MTMCVEWSKPFSQRLLEIIVHREYAIEADQRNDGKKDSTQIPRLALNSGRTGSSLKEEEEEEEEEYFITSNCSTSVKCGAGVLTAASPRDVQGFTLGVPTPVTEPNVLPLPSSLVKNMWPCTFCPTPPPNTRLVLLKRWP